MDNVSMDHQALWETLYDTAQAQQLLRNVINGVDLSDEAREALEHVNGSLKLVWETLEQGGAKLVADSVQETLYCQEHDC